MKKRNNYKFAKRKHSRSGIASTILGCLSMLLSILLIFLSYKAKGETGRSSAVTGFFAVFLCIIGWVLGYQGWKEEERIHLFAVSGMVLCSMVGIFWVFLIGIGIYGIS